MAEPQLHIRLLTHQDIYSVPNEFYTVPPGIETAALNELLNHVLRKNRPDYLQARDFDFLAAGELLRTGLIEHLQRRNVPVSADTVIEVEFIERVPAPQPEDSILHDDWVSGVEVAQDQWVLTGCYDNTVNIWTTHGKIVASSKDHNNFVKKVAWIDREDPAKGFLSVSHDQTALLSLWQPGTNKIQPMFVLRGHQKGVECVGVAPDFQKLGTGGLDTNLKIWSASLANDMDEPAEKRSRGGSAPELRTPLNTLKGHKQAICSVNWCDNHTVLTSSMDHTIKFWDTQLCGIKSEIVAQKSFFGSSWSPLTRTVVTCSADSYVRLYDPRSTEGSLCKATFKGHTNWISSVCWAKNKEHLFVSGGYDSMVKLWDTRSPSAPLFDLEGHKGQVWDVDCCEKYTVSGGSDNRLHVFRNMH